MSECNDKRFEKMLHAYELGILSDRDRKEFELHIMECEHCLEEVRRFDNTAEHIKFDEHIRDTVREITIEESTDEQGITYRQKLWKTLIPAAAAVLVFIILILKPWEIEIRPSHEAVAAQRRLIIMNFENLADPDDSQRLGEIAANLLITDLSESHYIQVVSNQQMYDIRQQIERGDSIYSNKDIAVEIARRANAQWVLMGSILQTEPELITTIRLIDVPSGDLINSQKIVGETDSTIFALIDKITVAIKGFLPIPSLSRQETDPMITEMTTGSTDAYRYYLDGIDYYRKRLYLKAQRSFEQVLEHDSTFAMAYYYLALIKDRTMLNKAVEYSDNCSEKDKSYIKSLQASRGGDEATATSILEGLLERYPDEKYALRLLGNSKYRRGQFEKAIEYYKRALKLDPYYKEVLNNLAYAYSRMGNFKKAIETNDIYISIFPDESSPYDARGTIYGLFGKLDSSIIAYRKALEITPDFHSSLEELGAMYIFNEEYDKAAECFHELASSASKSIRSMGRYYLALIPLYQGKIIQSLKVMDDCMAADRLEGAETEQGYKHIIKAVIYEGIDKPDSALSEIEKAMEFYGDKHQLYFYLLARSGKMAEADQQVEQLKDSLDDSVQKIYMYQFAAGSVNLVKGNFEESIISLEKAAEISDDLPVSYLLGRAYLESSRYNEAIEEFEKQLSKFTTYRVCRGIWSVKMHYYLGMSYEGAGMYTEAIKQYERFLYLWKDADMKIDEIEDAQARLARLTSKS